MWWQTIISGANKGFIANKIMKEVSSDGATVPLFNSFLQKLCEVSIIRPSPPPLPHHHPVYHMPLCRTQRAKIVFLCTARAVFSRAVYVTVYE
jgi:hypothetical protein